MTLKEELELLRGEPIKLKAPVEQIPCNETSNAEKLCKHPVVSVHMLTYNHEPYIAQAIEGVMMQQTDFEFELVIGEDASQDRTREICFEYQKRYPDKIRVLWSEENVTRPYGGNGVRVTARCRGEFIAFCEGDDYWTDPLKLQKQVDVMRAHPSVGLCLAGSMILSPTCTLYVWPGNSVFSGGVMEGKTFFMWHLFGKDPKRCMGPETFIMTATAMVRKSVLEKARRQFDVLRWQLRLGDTTMWLGLSVLSDVCFLADSVSVYRQHTGGACATSAGMVGWDSCLVRMYYAREVLNIGIRRFPSAFRRRFAEAMLDAALWWPKARQRQAAKVFWENGACRRVYWFSRFLLLFLFLRYGCLNSSARAWIRRYLLLWHSPFSLFGGMMVKVMHHVGKK